MTDTQVMKRVYDVLSKSNQRHARLYSSERSSSATVRERDKNYPLSSKEGARKTSTGSDTAR